jgi:hypothetical protein
VGELSRGDWPAVAQEFDAAREIPAFEADECYAGAAVGF